MTQYKFSLSNILFAVTEYQMCADDAQAKVFARKWLGSFLKNHPMRWDESKRISVVVSVRVSPKRFKRIATLSLPL